MLTALLPSRIAPISRSRSPVSRSTARARLSPAPARWCMRGREAAVRAVSEPEKKPDSAISKPIAPMVMAVSVVMGVSLRIVEGCNSEAQWTSFAEGLVEQGAERLQGHLPAEEGVPDAACQDERHPSALHLLVMLHSLDQCG